MHLIEIVPRQFQICILAEIQLHLIGNILRQFQNCLNQKSIAFHRSSSKTIPNFVLAEIQLHLIEIILRQFQIVSSKIIQILS